MNKSLTVMFRMWGSGNPEAFIKTKIADMPGLDLHFVLCTRPEDVELAQIAMNNGAEVIFADMAKFDLPINAMRARALELGHPSLIVSPGVTIVERDILEAFEAFEEGALTYSWQIATQLNDGTSVGKLGYHACWLDSVPALSMSNPLPAWVNNGELPDLSAWNVDGEIVTGKCGGVEEIVHMVQLMRKNPSNRFTSDTLFVHNASKILPMAAKTGTNVSFDWKIFRKTYVAKVYLAILCTAETTLMQHFRIIE